MSNNNNMSSGIKDMIHMMTEGGGDTNDDQTMQQLFDYADKLEQDLKLAKKTQEQMKVQNEHQIDITLSLEKELAVLRSKYYELERTTTLLKSHASESKLSIDEAQKEFDKKLTKKNKELDDLIANISYITKSEEELKKRYDELKEKNNNDEKNYQLKIKAMEKERSQYRSDVADLKHKNTKMDTDVDLRSKDIQIRSLSEQNTSLTREVTELKIRLESTVNALTSSQREIEMTKISFGVVAAPDNASRLQQSLSESESLKQSLQKEVSHLNHVLLKSQSRVSDLESQMKSIGNTEVHKMENLTLKDKLKRFEDVAEKYSVLQMKHLELVEECKTMSSIYGQVDKFSGVDQLQLRIRELEGESQVHIAKIGELTSLLKLTENRCVDMQGQVDDLKHVALRNENKSKEAEETINRLNKQVILYKREKDGIKRILDSFDVENAIAQQGTTSNGGTTKEFQTAQQARISELERASIEKDKMITTYENNIQNGSSSSLGDEGIDYKAEVTKMNSEIDRLLQENALLESRLGKGEFDQSKFKVLHMTSNPSQPTSAEAINNRETDSPGKEEVRIVQENHGLRVKLGETEKIMERLKTVFKSKINEFREVVYALFGFKIDMETNNLYKLQSMYADNENDFLVFQRVVESGKRIGKMELLDTDYTASLDREIRAYLFKLHSIPAFLGQLTIEQFSKQTFHPS
ncbi:hypothetical protein SAMD00019534_107650 [Acytostelium subglobosum LB1]|uniref:hypothetical protein n=1 Tax=Acytostelium subglobosum LB1 TaxID=1410327 RepID=UPI000644D73A|nr:hypothetical protein SAMD00019534_107650 [Acytostelium subglobosum LB1]GAM27589.1 hypothetical protein SAMD00019534_107650 [Acytostelium subglobosum LB1]|eukprot:XP_012749654.1 hypothetical protein SAMD00019534_107650 [Acytostelium subglobosum LB1]